MTYRLPSSANRHLDQLEDLPPHSGVGRPEPPLPPCRAGVAASAESPPIPPRPQNLYRRLELLELTLEHQTARLDARLVRHHQSALDQFTDLARTTVAALDRIDRRAGERVEQHRRETSGAIERILATLEQTEARIESLLGLVENKDAPSSF